MELDQETKNKLVILAQQVRRWAYVPYSKYPVGAALLTESGKIYDGVNIENASYSPTICAERVAVFKAVSEGERHFIAIAIVTDNAGSPCGVCRQVLAEFGLDILVILANDKGEVLQEVTVEDLLPNAFTPESLGYPRP